MGDSRAAGVFLGHTEGLTYVDSKGDGRYVLSNGKDQTMKLWDVREMVSTERFDTIDPTKYSSGFDYRYAPFEEDDYKPHPHDCSLVTFRGHKVLKTLIRCHFSPSNSSNSRYVYTGSFDGKVYIYNLDATLAGVIDVKEATQNSRPRDPDLLARFHSVHDSEMMSTGAWRTCVRDASWHPSAPIIAGTFCVLGYFIPHSCNPNGQRQQPAGAVGVCQRAPVPRTFGMMVLRKMRQTLMLA
jgi:DDB1- and CUL4-associated factor 11